MSACACGDELVVRLASLRELVTRPDPRFWKLRLNLVRLSMSTNRNFLSVSTGFTIRLRALFGVYAGASNVDEAVFEQKVPERDYSLTHVCTCTKDSRNIGA